jgi:hypothetical protein
MGQADDGRRPGGKAAHEEGKGVLWVVLKARVSDRGSQQPDLQVRAVATQPPHERPPGHNSVGLQRPVGVGAYRGLRAFRVFLSVFTSSSCRSREVNYGIPREKGLKESLKSRLQDSRVAHDQERAPSRDKE